MSLRQFSRGCEILLKRIKFTSTAIFEIFCPHGAFWAHWRYFGIKSAIRQVRRKDEPTLAFLFIWKELDKEKTNGN